MAVSGVGISTQTNAYVESGYAKKDAAAKDTGVKKEEKDAGAVYEKSKDDSGTAKATYGKNAVDKSAIAEKLKADSDARISQLEGIVRKMMSSQGNALAKADDMWKFLADGNFTVDSATREQAQKDIAEDGYWGAEQTSDRILDFAKSLAGDNPEKAEEFLNAFKKGYEEATKAWGKDLPELSKSTYDLVEKKFEKWKNGEE